MCKKISHHKLLFRVPSFEFFSDQTNMSSWVICRLISSPTLLHTKLGFFSSCEEICCSRPNPLGIIKTISRMTQASVDRFFSDTLETDVVISVSSRFVRLKMNFTKLMIDRLVSFVTKMSGKKTTKTITDNCRYSFR